MSIHDSGGERQLLIDLAHEADVPLTELTPASTKTLTALLDPGLPAVNPLDAWSTGGPDYHVGMQKCFSTLLADPGAAIGAVIHDRVAGGGIHASYIDYLKTAHAVTGKPTVLVANTRGSGTDALAATTTRAGFPVLDGVPQFLRGVKCLFEHRDGARARSHGPHASPTAVGVAAPAWSKAQSSDEHDAPAARPAPQRIPASSRGERAEGAPGGA